MAEIIIEDLGLNLPAEVPGEVCTLDNTPAEDVALSTGTAMLAVVPIFWMLIVYLVIYFIYKLIELSMFWRHVRRGSRIARVAASTLRQLRAAQPEYHPPTRHVWCSGEDVDTSSSPLLCVACCRHIAPLTPSQALNSCAACGVVAHDGCLRHVGDTCRPSYTPAGAQHHFWQVAGTERQEQRLSGMNSERDRILGSVGPCLYCDEEVAGGVYAVEPAWRCACCPALTHVRCYCVAHPEEPTVTAKFESKMKQITGKHHAHGFPRAASVGVGPPPAPAAGALGDPVSRGGSGQIMPPPTPSIDIGAHAHDLGDSPTALDTPRMFEEGPPTPAGLGFNFSRGQSPELGTLGLENLQLYYQRGVMEWKKEDLEQLDTCSLGPMQRLVLPSSCVRKTQPQSDKAHVQSKNNKEATKKDNTNGMLGKEGDGLLNGTSDAQKLKELNRKRSVQLKATSLINAPSSNPPNAFTNVNKKRSWWHRALARPRVQWNDWSIENLPTQCRPILVFVNVKSGPQVGELLHRRFLRLLHPLQVVCLPRDSPEPALRLFAFLPGVRILCVGGDGTAGWIMACLDKLAEEKREERRRNTAEGGAAGAAVTNGDENTLVTAATAPNNLFSDWTPPPVAIIPLGTGNDLARCLGWGSGYGSWRLEGASGALEAAAEASVALLDRWTLTFTEKPAAGLGLLPQQERASIVDGSGGAPSALENKKNNEKKSTDDAAPSDQTPASAAGNQISTTETQTTTNTATNLSIPGINTSNLSMLGLLSPRALSSSLTGTPRAPAPPPPPKKVDKAMSNYLGIGVDAKVALEFHEMRETYPQWFQSQFGNKLVYTGMGALDIVSGDELNLHKKVIIECDGEEVPLPRGSEGIIIVNIPSYMGGIDLWASGQGPGAVQGTQSMCDGRLEIVAVGGSWHLGQLTVGLSRAERLRQGRKIVIRTAEALPMQIDGEPFVQLAGEVSVALRGQSRVLRRVENKPIAKLMRAVEEALESAADKGVISVAQHDALAGELAARIHPQL